MLKLIALGASLLVVSGASDAAQGSPAASAGRAGATCDAKYYAYLVGKGLDEARSIDGTNYRMLTEGSERGDLNPKRMTIVYNAKSNVITEVGCG